MSSDIGTRTAVGWALTAAFFFTALWLLSPFFKIDASDYVRPGANVIRLFAGILILILQLGQIAFDLLAPQGLARKVSSLQGVIVLVFGVLLLALIVFSVAQAAALYLSTAASLDQPPT
jgi:signal transduction histidine kinase